MLAPLRGIPFCAQIVAGLALGVVLGLVARSHDLAWLAASLDTVGGVFVGLLKAAVPPLVVSAVVVSIARACSVSWWSRG